MKTDAQTLHKKIALIQWLSTLEDDVVIDKLIQFRKSETADWWSAVSDEEKASVEQGIADADNKKLSAHSTARKLYEKWL